ncbi:MAG: ECF transporter S component, partial [Clostridia bacterium]|nr:ECF transporter S component [Clostridia bacterium]
MTRESLRKMILAAIFIALIILLAFTPMLGYIKIGPLSITTIGIPVIIGAIILGPYYGMLLGFVFGMTSFLQCFMGDA